MPQREEVLRIGKPVPHSSRWRALRVGCLGIVVFLCAGVGSIGAAMQWGPVTLSLPGGNSLKIGSNDFVLSNYSFQNGRAFFVDLNGNGVRNIVQFNYLSDHPALEMVLRHADKRSQGERHLWSLPLP